MYVYVRTSECVSEFEGSRERMRRSSRYSVSTSCTIPRIKSLFVRLVRLDRLIGPTSSPIYLGLYGTNVHPKYWKINNARIRENQRVRVKNLSALAERIIATRNIDFKKLLLLLLSILSGLWSRRRKYKHWLMQCNITGKRKEINIQFEL